MKYTAKGSKNVQQLTSYSCCNMYHFNVCHIYIYIYIYMYAVYAVSEIHSTGVHMQH